MIVIGGGAVDASAELLELATMLQAPVVSFRSGRGVISDRHYLSQVLPAGYELWKTADVVLGIGSRMEQQLLHWKTAPGMKVIRVDIDADEFDRIEPPAVAIHGDAKSGHRRTDRRARPVDAAPAVARGRNSRRSRPASRGEIRVVQPQLEYLEAIRRALPDDGFFVDEITQVGYASWYGFPVYEPRHLVSCGYQGTLGYGYATALGVKVANPGQAGRQHRRRRRLPVHCERNGDRGAVRHTRSSRCCSTTAKFQNVQRQQKEWFGGRVIGSDLRNPDFVKYAESFGIRGVRVDGPGGTRARDTRGARPRRTGAHRGAMRRHGKSVAVHHQAARARRGRGERA